MLVSSVARMRCEAKGRLTIFVGEYTVIRVRP